MQEMPSQIRQTQPLRVVELFAGIGGFGLALERLGHKIVFANEYNQYAADIYDAHFTLSIDRRDITTVPAEDIPDHDLLVGGVPCQPFSSAGRHGGFEDTRGTLFFDLARIAERRQPRYIIIENVPGLLSHDAGRTFQTILGVLADLGYRVQWQVLRSSDFGVPQNRLRLYLVAHLSSQPRPEIFPLVGAERQDYAPRGDEQPAAEIFIATRHLGRNGHLTAAICPTIQASETPHIITGDGRIRRLTEEEAEVLQSFPAGFTQTGRRPDGTTYAIPSGQRYKCLGNAVTVNTVEAIVKRLPA